jgi:hypothetical protein
MADEFAKGLGIFTGGGLLWIVLAGWYRTSSFESTQQLVAPLTTSMESADLLNSMAITMMEVTFWFTILGTLAFWVGVPAIRQIRETLADSGGD